MAVLPSNVNPEARADVRSEQWPSDGWKYEDTSGAMVNVRADVMKGEMNPETDADDNTSAVGGAWDRSLGRQKIADFTHELFYRKGAVNTGKLMYDRYLEQRARWVAVNDGYLIIASRSFIDAISRPIEQAGVVMLTVSHKPVGDPTIVEVANFASDQADLSYANTADSQTETLPAADGGVGDLTYSVTGISGLDNATFTTSTRALVIDPAAGDVGTHTITYKVEDEFGWGTEQTFDLVVT